MQAAHRRVPAWSFVAAVLLLAGLWALDRYVFHLSVLLPFRGARASSPLYAFWSPVLRPEALAFAVLATLFAWLAPRLADPARAARPTFVASLVVAGIALPLALFLVRQDLGELGAPFRVYSNEEFWDDALEIPRTQDASAARGMSVFLRHYVELMPHLSLHGQHFPPGHALFLHASNTLFGTRLVTAALAVLTAAALGLVFAYLALRELLEEHAARQAAWLLASLPPFLDFACTSMDAVFFLWASLALWSALRALRTNASAVAAVVAGATLGFAALSSFAVLPMGLLLLAYALLLAVRRERAWSTTLRQLTAIGAGFALFLAAFWLATGFAWWDCILHARERGLALMTNVMQSTPSSRWAELSYGNCAAYLIYAGPGVAALLLARVAQRKITTDPNRVSRPRDAWTPAVLLTLCVMTLGGLFFMETERVWLFTLPWLVAAAMSSAALRPQALQCLLLSGATLALVLETFFFTLW
ncbi:MAG: glycosyltransferase family 39 protein [Planctomycetes bacterium]|nr:glycosyltransferase family 39 protein [Planctomycetota bacterium]